MIKKFLLTVLVLVLLLDISLFLDEKQNLFNGSLINTVENAKSYIFKKPQPVITETTEKISDIPEEPEQIDILRSCYPDVIFLAKYKKEQNDWLVTIIAPVFYGKKETKQIDLWWAEGKLLPEKELQNKDKYWSVIYPYQKLKDPALMTAEEIEKIKDFTTKENRQNGAGAPMFFYDFLYAAKSRVIIEDHIVRIKFLGKKTKVHERLKEPFGRVEEKIQKLAKQEEGTGNAQIRGFIENLKSADAYNWRIIEGTDRKSFHTYGIAMDVLPKKLGGKAIFWSWEKEKSPQNWMLIPLSKRWTPPQSVINAFEEEGFIWGGNWVIFDNMHFEYRPELLYNAKK